MNWSQFYIDSVFYAFGNVGDYPRSDMLGFLQDIAYILESGIKVALVYGDSDHACNIIGGGEVSLAINYAESEQFRAAGYTPIQANSSYIGGQVRQYGNFSFSRVYGIYQNHHDRIRMTLTQTDVEHEAPSYQPETLYENFVRSLTNRDIATGTISTTDNETYSTTGTSSFWRIKNENPEALAPTCYVRALLTSCTEDQMAAVVNGTALVRNCILIDDNTAALSNDAASNETFSGDRPSSPSSSPESGSLSRSSTGTSSGSPSQSTSAASTGDGFELEVQISFMALVLAIAVAVVP